MTGEPSFVIVLVALILLVCSFIGIDYVCQRLADHIILKLSKRKTKPQTTQQGSQQEEELQRQYCELRSAVEKKIEDDSAAMAAIQQLNEAAMQALRQEK